MLTASFSATQSELGADLIIRDTTDYSQEAKDTINNRVLKIKRADGTLYPSGSSIPFSYYDYPSGTITIPAFDRDYALTITMELTSNAAVPGSKYSRTITKLFNNYVMQFLFAITQEIAANPLILDKANFSKNLCDVIIFNECAKNAIAVSSVAASQLALDHAYKLINNKNLYF
jgi:hypothetical protein